MSDQKDDSKKSEQTTDSIVAKFIVWIIGLAVGIPVIIFLVVFLIFAFYGVEREYDYRKQKSMDSSNSAASEVLIQENSFIEEGESRSEGAPYQKSQISGVLSKSAYSNPDGFATSMEKMLGAENVATVVLEYSGNKILIVHQPSSDSVPSLTHQGWIDLLKMTDNPEIDRIKVDDQGKVLVSLAPYENGDVDVMQKNQEDYSLGLENIANLTAPDGLEAMTFEDGYSYIVGNTSLSVYVTGSQQTLQMTANLAQEVSERQWPSHVQILSVSESNTHTRHVSLTLKRLSNDVDQSSLEDERSKVQPQAQQIIDETQSPIVLYVYSGREELLTLEKL